MPPLPAAVRRRSSAARRGWSGGGGGGGGAGSCCAKTSTVQQHTLSHRFFAPTPLMSGGAIGIHHPPPAPVPGRAHALSMLLCEMLSSSICR